MSVNTNNVKQTIMVYFLIISSYFALISWLLFLAFNTKLMEEHILIKNYFALIISSFFIFKLSSIVKFESR